MHVLANVPYVFISERIQLLTCSSSCISLSGLSNKSPIAFLLTELFNICRFQEVSPYVALTFFVSTTPSFHFVSKNILEMELGEVLNGKEIYLKSDRGTQLVL